MTLSEILLEAKRSLRSTLRTIKVMSLRLSLVTHMGIKRDDPKRLNDIARMNCDTDPA